MGKIVIVAVAAAILIVIFIVYGTIGSRQNGIASGNASGSAMLSADSPAQTPTSSAAASPAPIRSGTAKTTAAPVIRFVTPVSNDIWQIGTQNLISWNTPGNFTGSISLIDAATKQFVGVILPQVGPKQTSDAWNTRDLLLGRTNPLKKDVVPGTYEIQIIYDGNNIRPAASPAFTITN